MSRREGRGSGGKYRRVLLLCVIGFSFLGFSQSHADTERVIDYEYDNAGNIVRIIAQEQSAPPVVSQLNPDFINIGRSISVTATGSNLLGVDVTTDATGLIITDVNPSVDQVTFRLTATTLATVGSAILRFTTGLGEAQESIFVAEPRPGLTTNPNPIAVAQSTTATDIKLIFTEPRPENETYTVSIGDSAIASTVAGSFTILAGSTEASIALIGVLDGVTSLEIVNQSKFFNFSFPVFVGKGFDELLAEFEEELRQRSLFGDAVGVLVHDGTKFTPGTASQVVGVEVGGHSGINLAPVGVLYGEGLVGRLMTGAVGVNLNDNIKLAFSSRTETILGALIEAIQPAVATAGTSVDFEVSGFNLSDVQNILLTPNTDITVDSFTVNAEGTQITITLTIDAAAALDEREIILEDTSGVMITRSGVPLKIAIQ
jgi:hypothetical protein